MVDGSKSLGSFVDHDIQKILNDHSFVLVMSKILEITTFRRSLLVRSSLFVDPPDQPTIQEELLRLTNFAARLSLNL